MNRLKRHAPPGMLGVGIVLLVIGFAQHGTALDFDNGFFALGVILTISGLVASGFGRKR